MVKSLGPLTRNMLWVALMGGCGAHGADPEGLGTSSLGLGSWTGSTFQHTLRVNALDTTVRNRCELTISVPGGTPLTFTASGTDGGGSSTTAVGWTGAAVTVPGLSVSACTGDPCPVTARWLGTDANGSMSSCQIVVDDGTTQLVATSSDSALTVFGAPSSTVIYHQHMRLGPTWVSSACTFRQNVALANADVSAFAVSLDGTPVGSSSSVPIGNTCSGKGPDVGFGTLYPCSDVTVTRLKHVTPYKEHVAEGDALRCAGAFENGILVIFDVNVANATTGAGMSLQTAPTSWTCSDSAFGSGDGCDCDCGVMDPDCGTHDCTHFTVTATNATNYTIDGQLDPTLNLVKGRTYLFDNSSGHPLAIHNVLGDTSVAARYDEGVTNQGVTDGQLKFVPPLTAPSTVYYQCELHSGMTGALNLADP